MRKFPTVTVKHYLNGSIFTVFSTHCYHYLIEPQNLKIICHRNYSHIIDTGDDMHYVMCSYNAS